MRSPQTAWIALALSISAFSIWLVWGTALTPDDFSIPQSVSRYSWQDMLLPTRETIAFPFEHYTHTIAYWWLGFEDRWGFEYLKAAYALLFLGAAYLFFRNDLSRDRALLAGFAAVFLTLHDATAFSFICHYLALSVAFYMLAVVCVRGGSWPAGTLFAVMGAFISYGSPALTLGFCVLLMLEGHGRRTLAVAIPGILYIAYYFLISFSLQAGPPRLQAEYSVLRLSKDMALQGASLVDAMVGPSAWLKLGLSIASVDALGALLAVSLSALLWLAVGRAQPTLISRPVLVGLSVTAVAALGLFSLTGRYPQVAFNLGDRVLLFPGLLMAYLLACLPKPGMLILYSFVLFLSSAGIADHWKQWRIEQERIIASIARRHDWEACPDNTGFVLVTGSQYSRLGPMSHIEFLSESYAAAAIFSGAGSPAKVLATVGPYYRYEQDQLIDLKNARTIQVKGPLMVWSTQTDQLQCVESDQLRDLIASQPRHFRHWIQLPAARVVADPLFRLFPQYAYLRDQ